MLPKHSFLITCLLIAWTVVTAQQRDIPKVDIPVEIEFSDEGGYYDEDVILEMRAPAANIFYTLDGSEPNKKSTKYEVPIIIKETTVVRAIAYRKKKKSSIYGHTYFMNEPLTTFPTISISICLLYTSPSPRDRTRSRMPSSA